MNRTALLVMLTCVLSVAGFAQNTSHSNSDQGTNSWTLTVEKAAREESIVDLHNPRSVTICSDTLNPVFLSIDQKHWHRLELPHDECVAVPPVRFVKLKVEGNETSAAEVYATY